MLYSFEFQTHNAKAVAQDKKVNITVIYLNWSLQSYYLSLMEWKAGAWNMNSTQKDN